MTKLFLISALLMSTFALGASAETRIGWFMNETPGNASLVDKDGEWIISEMGQYQAEGSDNLNLTANESEMVYTNRTYGYSCASISGDLDKAKKAFIKIASGEQLRLSQCSKELPVPTPTPIPSAKFSMQLAKAFGNGFALLTAVKCEADIPVRCALAANEWLALDGSGGHNHVFSSANNLSALELFNKMSEKSGVVRLEKIGGATTKTTEADLDEGSFSLGCIQNGQDKSVLCTFTLFPKLTGK